MNLSSAFLREVGQGRRSDALGVGIPKGLPVPSQVPGLETKKPKGEPQEALSSREGWCQGFKLLLRGCNTVWLVKVLSLNMQYTVDQNLPSGPSDVSPLVGFLR